MGQPAGNQEGHNVSPARKRIAEKKDKEALIKSIELINRELDSKAEEDPNGEKELASLQEALRNLNEDEVKHAAREKVQRNQIQGFMYQ